MQNGKHGKDDDQVKYRIALCGGNGAGKSTLGKELAKRLNIRFMDIEQYYFPYSNTDYAYGCSRTQEEVTALLLDDMKHTDDFVLAAVKADYSPAISRMFTHAVYIDVPKEERMNRIRQRSFQKFGERMMPGGDLHEGEEAFFKMAEARDDGYVEKWLKDVSCPIIRIDGTKPTEENVEYIIRKMNLWILFEGASADG